MQEKIREKVGGIIYPLYIYVVSIILHAFDVHFSDFNVNISMERKAFR